MLLAEKMSHPSDELRQHVAARIPKEDGPVRTVTEMLVDRQSLKRLSDEDLARLDVAVSFAAVVLVVDGVANVDDSPRSDSRSRGHRVGITLLHS